LGLLAAAVICAVIASAGVVVPVFPTRDRRVVVGDAAFPSAMAEDHAVIHPDRPRPATSSERGAKAAAAWMLGLSLEDLGVYSDMFADGGPAV
jgi:hypothetical protein